MPKISVIVPIYNVEKFLPTCIDSVLNQTFPDFELILVDDGSTDQCPVICDEYAEKDCRIQVIHKENGGASCARNTALETAKGEYITFCDSDDFYAETWLEEQYSAIQSADADLAIGQYSVVNEEGCTYNTSKHECGLAVIQTVEDRIDYTIKHVFGGKHGWEVWTRLFRTSIIRNHHIRFCESCGNFAEDLGFVLEYVLFAEKVVSIPVAGYFYRIRSGSMMQTSKKQVKLDAVNEVSQQYISALKKGQNYSCLKRVIPIFHFLIMCNQYGKLLGTEQYQYLKQYTGTIRRYKEWRTLTKQIFGCYKELVKRFGKGTARRILLLSHYCLHGNWKRFTIESAIAYKWFIKEK